MPVGNRLFSGKSSDKLVASSQQANYTDDEIFYQENPSQPRLVKVNDQVKRLQTIIRDR